MPALYPKIPHLSGSRTGPSDRHVSRQREHTLTVAAREGARIVVEEKLDGTCVAVAREGDSVVAYGRGGRLARSSRNVGRRLFARWVFEERERLFGLLDGFQRACGEWLPLAHGTIYDLPHEPFVLFDLLDDKRALCREQMADRARAAGLTVPCILHKGAALPTSEALLRLGAGGKHGAAAAEGVVYREEDPRDGTCRFVAKLVRQAKVDGLYLADHTGKDHVFNTWPGSQEWLAEALAEDEAPS